MGYGSCRFKILRIASWVYLIGLGLGGVHLRGWATGDPRKIRDSGSAGSCAPRLSSLFLSLSRKLGGMSAKARAEPLPKI